MSYLLDCNEGCKRKDTVFTPRNRAFESHQCLPIDQRAPKALLRQVNKFKAQHGQPAINVNKTSRSDYQRYNRKTGWGFILWDSPAYSPHPKTRPMTGESRILEHPEKGSEDELEVSSQNQQTDHSMDRAMVPPQLENSLEILKVSDYPSNNNLDDTASKLTLKPADQLYEKLNCDDKYFNGLNLDLSYTKCKEVVAATGAVPCEVELKEGVVAKSLIPKGTRYGPFQGKWAGVPQDARFAWELLCREHLRISPDFFSFGLVH
ncbi:hypothetical protein GEV33_003018 [Tenebrio molitor]|uniref:Uncharacterized protein n=1 Tax=Tenebrio molitor TaxID=7067 RepID=A0A8J6LI53_TENMO|nr:hypothetical protein GEV33_003018 [Tenebrio molitor]